MCNRLEHRTAKICFVSFALYALLFHLNDTGLYFILFVVFIYWILYFDKIIYLFIILAYLYLKSVIMKTLLFVIFKIICDIMYAVCPFTKYHGRPTPLSVNSSITSEYFSVTFDIHRLATKVFLCNKNVYIYASIHARTHIQTQTRTQT